MPPLQHRPITFTIVLGAPTFSESEGQKKLVQYLQKKHN